MDTMHALHTRRSIRKYTDEPVDEATVRDILAAAMTAPSACNQQPWEFVVVTDRDRLAKVKDFSPHAGMAAQAALGILVCAEPGREKCPGYWVQDCAAAVENLLLAAHAKGLGAVWTGVYPKQDRMDGFRVLCGLPDSVEPVAFVVLGHPAQEAKYEDRYDAAKVHHDTF